MTTKYLTGAYPSGYALSSKYTGLDIAATASVGGNGVSASFLATISNFGDVSSGPPHSDGVYLSAGDVVTNGSAADTTALIQGYGIGVHVKGSQPSTITNFGAIKGYTGVRLDGGGGGSVTNGSASDTTALIEGGNIGVSAGGNARIANFGTILATGDGVDGARGSITNGSTSDTTALISGGTGINLSGSVTLTNFATIQGSIDTGAGNYGVAMSGGGAQISNGSAVDTTALIAGRFGVKGDGTLTNFGTIQGTGGVAVQLVNSDSLLRVESGCVFEGAVVGGGGGLNLASGKGRIDAISNGNITVTDVGQITIFNDFQSLTISKGAQFTLTGSGVISASTESLGVNGLLSVSGKLLAHGSLFGAGTVALRAGGMAEVDQSTASTLTLAFRGATATLDLAAPSTFAATIAGFAASDAIDLLNITATSAVLGPGDTLMITNGSTAVATLQLSGNYTGDTFATASDGHGGTSITVASGGGAASPGAAPRTPHVFIAALASLGAQAGAPHLASPAYAHGAPSLLVAPRAQMA